MKKTSNPAAVEIASEGGSNLEADRIYRQILTLNPSGLQVKAGVPRHLGLHMIRAKNGPLYESCFGVFSPLTERILMPVYCVGRLPSVRLT